MHYILVYALLCAWPAALRADLPYFDFWIDFNSGTGRQDASGSHDLGCSNHPMDFVLHLRSLKGKFKVQSEQITLVVNGQPAPGSATNLDRVDGDYLSSYRVITTQTSQQDFLLTICVDFDARLEDEWALNEVDYDEDDPASGWEHFHTCKSVTILGQHPLPTLTLSPAVLCGNAPFTFCADNGTAPEGAMYLFTLPPGLRKVSGGGDKPCIVVDYDPNVPFTGGQLSVKRGSVCSTPYEMISVNLPAARSAPVKVNVLNITGCDGSCALSVSVNGGQAPFTFTFSDGGATRSISSDTRTCVFANLPCSAQAYSGTITDQNGCKADWTYTMPNPANHSFVRESAYYLETVTTSMSGLPACKMTLASFYRSKLAGASMEWYREPVSDPPTVPPAATGNAVSLPEGDYLVKVITAEGCFFWKKVHVPACTGTIGYGEDDGITDVYPNPTTDIFLVGISTRSDNPIRIKAINNSTLMEVYNQDAGIQSAGYQIYSVDLSGQPAGNYTLVVEMGSNAPQTRTVIKQ